MVDLVSVGAINWDITLYVDRFVGPGEEMFVRRIKRVPGGTAANIAVAAARILGRDRVAFIGALGDDEIAKIQVEILKREGIDHSGIKFVRGMESGQAYILVDKEGRNIIYTFLEIKKQLRPEDMDDDVRRTLIEEAKGVIVTDPPIETAKRIFEIAKKSNVITFWDPGIFIHEGFEKLRDVLPLVDYFILNHHEFKELLGTNDPTEVYNILSKYNNQIRVVIKMGSKGSAVSSSSGVTFVRAVPLDKLGLKVVNTVGCGDAFIGAFVSAKILGHDDKTALKWGNAGGAFKATQEETRGSPTMEQLKMMLEKAEELGIWD